jgi:hypothetical protein
VAQGALTADGSGEEVAPASDYRALQSQVRELQRLLDGCEAAKEREKIEECQKQATEEKILPRDRPVVKCLDGATGPSQPSAVAPEYQELAAGRAKQKERVDNCQEQATEQKVLPRDRPQFVISCLEK